MENQLPSSKTTTKLTDYSELVIISNPIEFESSVRFRELIETPLETIKATTTTPNVLNNTKIVLSSTAPVNVTNFLNGQEGQTIFVVGDGQSTIKNNATISTNGNADKLASSGSVYCFTLVNGVWRELAAPTAAAQLVQNVTIVSFGGDHTIVFTNTDEDYLNDLHYMAHDTTGVTQYRTFMQAITSTNSATTQVKIFYSTNATTWTQLGSTLSFALATKGQALSSYAAMPSGAIGTTVYFKVTVRTDFSPGVTIGVISAMLNLK
jgi:hypothetical protein